MSAQLPRRYLFYVEHNYCFGILRPIQKVIRQRGAEVAWFPAGNEFDRAGFRPGEQVLDRVGDAIEWKPHAVLVPGNFVPGFLPGVKVMVQHGLLSQKRRRVDGQIYHFIDRGMFDLYITQGPNDTAHWQEKARRAGYFEVAECGWSKLDPLFDGSLARTPSTVPVIYFASTFSPRLTAAPHLVETVGDLAARRDWQWLVHFHPNMPRAVTDRYRAIQSPRLRVAETHEALQLLLDADVMVCDTSSIISEFAVLNKPVVTFCNLSPTPFMIDVRKPEDLEAAIERALSRPAELMAAIARYGQDTHPYTDGRSSERILDAVDDLARRGLGHLKPKPRNWIRHLKLRFQLHWYRPG